jgi:hypothetical protein
MNSFIFAIFCSVAALAFAVDTFGPGTQLDVNNAVYSPNQEYRLNMQNDGNLVLYGALDGYYRWSTNTGGSGANKAIMLQDGQFCLQTASGAIAWSTSTFDAGSVCRLQNDGNLVVYNAQGTPVWNAGGYKKTTI